MTTSKVEAAFPRLRYSDYSISSPETLAYNCIAWAVGRDDRWWWPSKSCYWPRACPRKATVDAFVTTFKSLGYETCNNGTFEDGWQKIALYAMNGKPTHAARQLASGKWASKLGPSYDIEHDLDGLYGHVYGTVAQYFKRPAQ